MDIFELLGVQLHFTTNHYDKNLWKIYFWVSWYPVIYWAFNSLATVVATPKGLFRNMNKAAVWVSPDRGIRG